MKLVDLINATPIEFEMFRAGRDLDTFLSLCPVGVIETDGQGNVRRWNEAAEQLTGWSAGEVIGKHASMLYPDRSLLDALQTELVRKKRLHGFRMPVENKGGQPGVHLLSATCLEDGAGRLTGVVAVFDDITEKDRAQTALQVKNIALQNAYDGIVILYKNEETGEVKVEFANNAFVAISGYSEEELFGMSPFSLLSGDPVGCDDQDFVVNLRNNKSIKVEAGIRQKSGGRALVEATIMPMLSPELKGRHYVAVIRDIGHRRKMEEALKASEARFRSLVQTTTDVITLVDKNGIIFYQSPAVQTVLGYSPDEMLGSPVFKFMASQEQTELHEIFEELRRVPGAQSVLHHVRTRKRDGSPVNLDLIGTNMLDDPNIGFIVLNWRDVTELRTMQEQLAFSERLVALGTLSAGVAHEINNPLAYVMANLEFCTRRAQQLAGEIKKGVYVDPAELEEMWEAMTEAQNGAERVRKTVGDLKAFSRQDEDDFGAVELEPVLESSIRIVWNEIKHRARLNRSFEGVSAVYGDPSKLGQVFLNLLVNATQAIPEGAPAENEICVSTRDDGQRIVVEIRDSGVGITPKNIKKLFNPFFTTKPVGQGTGLGLSVCHGLVKAMGGEISACNNPVRGATFRVTLPKAKQQKRQFLQANQKTVQDVRLLVIDDEAMVAKSIGRLLEGKVAVRQASGGKAALALLAAGEDYDLILCDLLMPEMSGMELYKQISTQRPEYANRFVFMTGGAFTPASQRFVDDPSRLILEKPFSVTTLNDVINKAVRNLHREPPDTVVATSNI